MKPVRAFVLACFFAMPVAAQTAAPVLDEDLFFDGTTLDLSEFKWKKRPVVVFADTPEDPAFIEQMELLDAGRKDLIERSVVVLTDTDPAARSDLRLKLRPRGFMLVLIGKDGGVKLRKPFPWHTREITRSIDKTPERELEIREQKDRAPMTE